MFYNILLKFHNMEGFIVFDYEIYIFKKLLKNKLLIYLQSYLEKLLINFLFVKILRFYYSIVFHRILN